MFKTIDFVEALRLRLGTEEAPASYYRVAKTLGVRQTTLTNYRKERTGFDDFVAVRAAKLLDLPPAFVVACANSERSRALETKTVWEEIEAKFCPPPLLDFLSHFSPLDAARALHRCILCSIPTAYKRIARNKKSQKIAQTYYWLSAALFPQSRPSAQK